MAGTIGDGTFESHAIDHTGDVVVIDKLGVAEHFGLHAEQLFYFCVMSLDLKCKLFGILQRRQAVCIGLTQNFHAPSFGKLLHGIDELRNVLFQLFKRCAAYGKSNFEFLSIVANHLQQGFACRHIRAMSNASDDVIIGKVIVVVVVIADVEESVVLQTEWLVYLKIKTDCFHCSKV